MGDVPAVVVVGAASRDLVHDDPRGWRLGGGVSYAALTLARLGLRVGALIGADRLAAESRELHVLRDAGVEVAVARLDRGPVFINTETPNGRIQHAPQVSDPVAAGGAAGRLGEAPARGCSARSRPSCRTRGPRCHRADARVALGWQGLLRVLVAGEPVTQHPPGPVADRRAGPISSASAATTSTRRRPMPRSSRFLHPGATMLLTDGAQGGLAIDVGRGRRRPGAAAGGRRCRSSASWTRSVPATRSSPACSPRASTRRCSARTRARTTTSWSAPSAASLICEGPGMIGVPTARGRAAADALGDRERLACRAARGPGAGAGADRRAPRRRRSASRRGCARPIARSRSRSRQAARVAARAPAGSASRCSRSFATSIQAMTPRPPPAAAAVCHASAASDHRPSRRSTRARSAASRSSVQRPPASHAPPVSQRRGARSRSERPAAAVRRVAPPARARRPAAERRPHPRRPPRLALLLEPLLRDRGRDRRAPERVANGWRRAEGVVEARERVLVALLPAVRAGEPGEVAARRVVARRPVRVAPLDVGEQQAEAPDVLLVVDDDAGEGVDRAAAQHVEVDRLAGVCAVRAPEPGLLAASLCAGLMSNTLCERKKKAQGQWLGRCRTGRRWGRASRAGMLMMRRPAWSRVRRRWRLRRAPRRRAAGCGRSRAQDPGGVGAEAARGHVGQWPVDQIGEHGFDDRVLAVGDVGLGDGQVGVGEERVIPPDREEGVAVAGILDAAHHQPGGDPIFRGCEGGVADFGDLGIGDPRAGVGITDRTGVAHRGPGVLVDRGDGAFDRGVAGHHQRELRACAQTGPHHRAVAVGRIAAHQNLARRLRRRGRC